LDYICLHGRYYLELMLQWFGYI